MTNWEKIGVIIAIIVSSTSIFLQFAEFPQYPIFTNTTIIPESISCYVTGNYRNPTIICSLSEKIRISKISSLFKSTFNVKIDNFPPNLISLESVYDKLTKSNPCKIFNNNTYHLLDCEFSSKLSKEYTIDIKYRAENISFFISPHVENLFKEQGSTFEGDPKTGIRTQHILVKNDNDDISFNDYTVFSNDGDVANKKLWIYENNQIIDKIRADPSGHFSWKVTLMPLEQKTYEVILIDD